MNSIPLRIVGVYSDTPAYPNVYYLISALRSHPQVSVDVLHSQGWQPATHGRHGRRRIWHKLASLLWAHIRILAGMIWRPTAAVVYIPYPATPLASLLSWFGRRVAGEHIVIDAFISLYDTIVCDRKLYPANSFLAKVLFRIEKRAFRFADCIMVDTAENADYLAQLFDTPRSRFMVCPLFTDEENLSSQPYEPGSGIQNILFVGTMVPLHGIATVISAARLLQGKAPVHFTIIGDGQERARLLNAPDNVSWQKNWVDEAGLAKAIADADICLGIFGESLKADRVIPLKIYAYCRTGRAIITATTTATRSITAELLYEPFCCVPAGDAASLAEAITRLASDRELRNKYGDSAGRFYRDRLSNEKATGILIQALSKGLQ